MEKSSVRIVLHLALELSMLVVGGLVLVERGWGSVNESRELKSKPLEREM